MQLGRYEEGLGSWGRGNLCLEMGAGQKTTPKGGESSGDPLRTLHVLRCHRHGCRILLNPPGHHWKGPGDP